MLGGLLDGIADLAVGALNAVITALGATLQGFIELLPDMPMIPAMPASFTTAAGWVAWVFPISTLLDVLAFVLSMWLLWQVVAIALRWAKALNA